MALAFGSLSKDMISPAMAYLELRNVSKAYGCGEHRVPVVRGFSLTVNEGECLALLGEPGSGKSTILSLVAGLTLPDFGSINLNGRPIAGPGPDRLFLSQACALLPALTVLENLGAAVESVQPTASKEACRRRAERLLDACGLTALARKRSLDLAVGQRKRVALARTLAMNPDVLLLDDPFTGLDAASRAALQTQTAEILSGERKTCLLATDDVNEALMLADRIVPLTHGHEGEIADPIVVDVPHPRDRRQLQHGRLLELRRALTARLRTLRDRCTTYTSAIA